MLGGHRDPRLYLDQSSFVKKGDAARKQGRTGGRRPKLRPNQQDEIVTMVSTGTKTAADAARLFNVQPATVLRLLAKAGAGTILG